MKLFFKLAILFLGLSCLPLQAKELGFATPADKGMDPNLTQRLDSIINEALEMGAFPGCQLLGQKTAM